MKSSKVLLKNDPPDCAISRIATILQTILSNILKPANSCLALFFQLLPFIENTGVFQLFIDVTSENPINTTFLEMLTNTSFADLFFLEFDNKPSKIKIGNLSRILYNSSVNPILGPSFHKPQFVDKLVPYTFVTEADTSYEDVYLKNNIWRAMSSLVTKETLRCARKAVPLALYVITERPIERPASYHCFCFNFLANILKYDTTHVQDFRDRHVVHTMQDLIVKFGDFTDLQSSIFRFIRVALNWKDYSVELMDEIMDLLVSLCNLEMRNASTANAMKLFLEINEGSVPSIEVVKMFRKRADYKYFTTKVLKPYEKILNSKYGGNIPN